MEKQLDQQVNHRIAILAGIIKRQIHRIISEECLEITPDQWVILNYLWEENGLSIGDLVKKSRKDFANVTRIVDRLERQGYVQKEKNKNDGRSFLVYYTPKAKEIKSKVEACQKKSLEISLKGISVKDQELFLQIIDKMERNSLAYLN